MIQRIVLIFTVLMILVTPCISFGVSLDVTQNMNVDLYGSVRFQTLSVSHSSETANIPYSLFSSYGGLASTDDDYNYTSFEMERYLSRFGCNFKMGGITGKVEIRPVSGSIYRHWYAGYKSPIGNFVIGHTWDPLFFATVKSSSLVFGGVGGPLTDIHMGLRLEQLTWSSTVKNVGKVTIGLTKPNTSGDVNGLTNAKKETSIPGFRATYFSEKSGPFQFKAFGGYNQYTITSTSGEDYDVNGMVYGIGATIDVNKFGGGLNFWGAKNPNVFASSPHYAFENPVYDAVKDNVKDTDINWGFYTQMYYKFMENARAVLECGMREAEVPSVTGSPGFTRKLTTVTFSLPFKNVFQKGITLMPTFEYVDWGEKEYSDNSANLDLGDTIIYGIYFQVDF
ncbi:hypothetical protein [Desulfocicer niacini]